MEKKNRGEMVKKPGGNGKKEGKNQGGNREKPGKITKEKTEKKQKK